MDRKPRTFESLNVKFVGDWYYGYYNGLDYIIEIGTSEYPVVDPDDWYYLNSE